MNDAQIVLSLMNFYRNEGIDLHHLLDDPIFSKLALQTRIDMMKTYAADIAAGINPKPSMADFKASRKDLFSSAIMGGVTGVGATMTTAALFQGGRPSPLAVILGGVTGLGTGLALATMRRGDDIAERAKLRNRLLQLAKSKSDEHAVQALALRGLQNKNRAVAHTEFNKLLDRVQTFTDTSATNAATKETVRANMGRPFITPQ